MTDLEPPPEQSSSKPTSFTGDVLRLASGRTIAQVVAVLAAPFMARLFAPDAFGTFALLSAITYVLAAVFTLEYELTIMLPEQDRDAANLLAGTLGIAFLFSFLALPILWLAGPWLARILNAPSLISFLWLVPLILAFGGLGAGHPALNAWAGRTRRFAHVATAQVAGTLTSTLGKLAAGFAGFNSGGGLMTGATVGSAVSPLLLGWQIWKQDRLLFLNSIHPTAIWANLKRYRKFAIYNTPSSLLYMVSWQTPSFLLAAFFSPTVVGFFAFGNQLLNIPMGLVGWSVSQAFFAHATTANQRGELTSFVESTFRRLVEYSFFPVLMLMIVGRDLFLIVFGPTWTEAGVYVQILSIWLLLWFISWPMSQLINVLEKNEFFLGWNVVNLVTRILSIWLGAALGSARLALLFFSISGALVYGYLSIWIILKTGTSWPKIVGILSRNLVIFVPAGCGVLVLSFARLPVWVNVGAAASLIGLYYIYRFKDESRFKNALISIKSRWDRET